MPETHSRLTARGREVWMTERLWALAATLPVFQVKIADIPEFEEDCWFLERHAPTVRKVAEHAKRIFAADLAIPVILNADGRLMDGGHRICKAWIEGRTTVAAVRFPVTPEPDEIRPAPLPDDAANAT